MTAMPTTEVDRFSLLEMDFPSKVRQPIPTIPEAPIELDMTDSLAPHCLACGKCRPVNESSTCQECAYEQPSEFGAAPEDIAPNTPDYQGALEGIAAESAANAATAASGGFRHIRTVTSDNAAVPSTLPEGAGIKHTPTGPSIFDQPKAQRAFLVGPRAEVVEKLDVALTSKELVAGGAAEGHHAIVAWEGTSGMTRGEVVTALTSIGREAWAPKAPNARAQAGSAIASLASGGLLVRALRKGEDSQLAAGEHVWTCGRVNHTGAVGEAYGAVTIRFKLSGSTLTYEGPENVGNAVVVSFESRMASEVFKSSDVTGWLSRTIRGELDGVRFGALGWLVPARHVAAAKQLCEAVQGAGFGAGWVTGLPVATSDQLRDGIVRGLVDEASDVVSAIRVARADAKAAKDAALSEAHGSKTGRADPEAIKRAFALSGDIGQTRATTYLKELRAIGARVVAYGQVLGETRVEQAQITVRDAMAELEGLLGSDYSGIRERFSLIWEEIELDRKRTGGVL